MRYCPHCNGPLPNTNVPPCSICGNFPVTVLYYTKRLPRELRLYATANYIDTEADVKIHEFPENPGLFCECSCSNEWYCDTLETKNKMKKNEQDK